MSKDFLDLYRELIGEHGRPSDKSPWDVVERWEALVDECAECYEWGFYEFDNEIHARSLLERMLTEPRFDGYEQIAVIQARVAAADERFRQLLSDRKIRAEGTPWWERAVLRRAGEEYVDDMERLYGVTVDHC